MYGIASSLTEVQPAVVPVAGEEEEAEGDHGCEEDVQDAEEDGAGGHADGVAAVRDAEGDGVDQPEQVYPARQEGVVAGDPDAGRTGAAMEQRVISQHCPGDRAEAEEAPLVVGSRQRRDEVRDHPSRQMLVIKWSPELDE